MYIIEVFGAKKWTEKHVDSKWLSTNGNAAHEK
jgi:hypothetical protein